jgi:hypothetical protein
MLVDERASINRKRKMYIPNDVHSVSHFVILAFCRLYKLVVCMCVLTVTESNVSCVLNTNNPITLLLDTHKMFYNFISYTNTVIHLLL